MMDTGQPHLGIVFLSAGIAIVLQLVVAPVIAILGVVPNFVLVTAVIIAMHNGPVRSTVTGFLLGLFLDFTSLGPIGAMSLVLTILTYAASSLNKRVLTGSVAVDMVIMLLSVILGEFLVSVIYAIVGVNPEFLLSLVFRVLPAIIYDAVIGLVLMLIYNAVVNRGGSFRSGGSGGRSLTRKLNM